MQVNAADTHGRQPRVMWRLSRACHFSECVCFAAVTRDPFRCSGNVLRFLLVVSVPLWPTRGGTPPRVFPLVVPRWAYAEPGSEGCRANVLSTGTPLRSVLRTT